LLWEVEATASILGRTSLPSVDAHRPDSARAGTYVGHDCPLLHLAFLKDLLAFGVNLAALDLELADIFLDVGVVEEPVDAPA
jgi:hypothetical protein